MAEKEFVHVDTFTSRLYTGNPALVVFDCEDLSVETMQAIAREVNLSETAFVLPTLSPGADYRIRIFTRCQEIPFAGHPTLAVAHALFERGVRPSNPTRGIFRQECGAGIIEVEIRNEVPAERMFIMRQGAPSIRPVDFKPSLASLLLGCQLEDIVADPDRPMLIVSTGLPWIIVPLRSLNALARLDPNFTMIANICRQHDVMGITAFCEGASQSRCRLRVRTFAPGAGILEDPVCGSGNGCVAAYLASLTCPDRDQNREFSYFAEQGVEIGQQGIVFVHVQRAPDGTSIRVGGEAVTVMSGRLAV